jgi:hypothetical protein
MAKRLRTALAAFLVAVGPCIVAEHVCPELDLSTVETDELVGELVDRGVDSLLDWVGGDALYAATICLALCTGAMGLRGLFRAASGQCATTVPVSTHMRPSCG